MIAILRQYAMVLLVIVSRPWMLLMLGMGLLYVGPFLGAWIVGDESAGLGIRESPGLITDNISAFVPHRIQL